MNTYFKKYTLPIVFVLALVLSACSTPATPDVQATVQAAVAATLTAPEAVVVIGPDNTAVSCKGTYGVLATDGFVIDFTVPAGQTMTFPYVKGGQNRAVEIECPANGLGVTVKRDYEIPTVGGATATGEFQTGWETAWYWSPFRQTTDALTDEATHETFAEPGVLLDNTAAFDHMSASDTPILVPEGGYAYVAVGAMTLTHDGASLALRHEDKNIYLVTVRGLPADGTDVDLNQIVMATDYVRGAGIYSPMPADAYVSLGWFEQQIQNSYDDPNCGREGCKKITIVVVDLQTHTFRSWITTNPSDLRDWTRVP